MITPHIVVVVKIKLVESINGRVMHGNTTLSSYRQVNWLDWASSK